MADKKLNAFTAAAAWTSTCSVVGSDSASPTGSFLWDKSKFDAVYAPLSPVVQNIGNADETIADDTTLAILTEATTAARTYTLPLTSNKNIGDAVTIFAPIALGYFYAPSLVAKQGADTVDGASSTAIFNGCQYTSITFRVAEAGKWVSDRILMVGPGGGLFCPDAKAGIYGGNASSGLLYWGSTTTANPGGALGSNRLLLHQTSTLQWSSNFPTTEDTGLARASAGVVEVNNGTAGTLRDINARNFAVNGIGTVQTVVTSAQINLKNTGTTTIYTVPTGKNFVLVDALMVSENGDLVDVTVGPLFAIDTTSGGLSDGPAAADIANATDAGAAIYLTMPRQAATSFGIGLVATSAQAVRCNVSTGATATTCQAKMVLMGYLY